MSAEGALRDGTAAGFELIETLRWEPGKGFTRLARHLERLRRSAADLGFVHEPKEVGAALDRCATGASPLRVRLTLAPDGRTDTTVAPFAPLPRTTVWTLRIAGQRLHSADPLLRHKTTRRQAYEAARAEFPREEADEVLLLNERGEACEGTITNLFADFGDGVLLTPALRCGLLPGILRAELLEQRVAAEAVLTAADLRRAKVLSVGNSLRGMIGARLA